MSNNSNNAAFRGSQLLSWIPYSAQTFKIRSMSEWKEVLMSWRAVEREKNSKVFTPFCSCGPLHLKTIKGFHIFPDSLRPCSYRTKIEVWKRGYLQGVIFHRKYFHYPLLLLLGMWPRNVRCEGSVKSDNKHFRKQNTLITLWDLKPKNATSKVTLFHFVSLVE